MSFLFEIFKLIDYRKIMRRKTDSKNWGGNRSGSGRKRKLLDPTSKTFILERRHLDLIQDWEKKHRLRNASEALRAMLDTVFNGKL